jgi:hypothetical protein
LATDVLLWRGLVVVVLADVDERKKIRDFCSL